MSAKVRTVLSDAEYERFRELIDGQIGIEIPSIRRRDLDRAVGDALATTGLRDADQLYERLAHPVHGRDVLAGMVPTLTVGETHFFRNRPQMEALERRILPELLERRGDRKRLRVWSAGCSTGEEPYSIAILLDRLLPDRSSWDLSILATDLNANALRKAERGVYGTWSFRGVPDDVKRSYFDRDGDRLHLAPRIRAMVTLVQLNLVEDSYPSAKTGTTEMDLILCRNVLIYFREATTRLVVARLHDALVPGGWLVVGHVEPSQQVFGDFRVQNLPGTIAYQRVGRGVTAAPQPPVAAKQAPIPAPRRRERPRPAKPPADRTPARRDGSAAYEEAKRCAGELDLEAAERVVGIAVREAPMAGPVHYLQGVILQERGDLVGALEALRRCLYVDPKLALGHVALAGVQAQLGQGDRARKALDNAARLIEGREGDEEVPGGDGLTFGRLRELVELKRELAA